MRWLNTSTYKNHSQQVTDYCGAVPRLYSFIPNIGQEAHLGPLLLISPNEVNVQKLKYVLMVSKHILLALLILIKSRWARLSNYQKVTITHPMQMFERWDIC